MTREGIVGEEIMLGIVLVVLVEERDCGAFSSGGCCGNVGKVGGGNGGISSSSCSCVGFVDVVGGSWWVLSWQ